MHSSTPVHSRADGCWGVLGSQHPRPLPESRRRGRGRGSCLFCTTAAGCLATPELVSLLSGALDPVPLAQTVAPVRGATPKVRGTSLSKPVLQPTPTGTLPDPRVGGDQPCCTLKSPGKSLIPIARPTHCPPRRRSLPGCCEPGIWPVHKASQGVLLCRQGGGYCSPPERAHFPPST